MATVIDYCQCIACGRVVEASVNTSLHRTVIKGRRQGICYECFPKYPPFNVIKARRHLDGPLSEDSPPQTSAPRQGNLTGIFPEGDTNTGRNGRYRDGR